jgi:Tol biopolymer transport system component
MVRLFTLFLPALILFNSLLALVAMMTGQRISADQIAYIGANHLSNIYLMDLAHRRTLNLTHFGEPLWVSRLAWSPDGRHLAYHLRDTFGDLRGEIEIMRLPERTVSRLILPDETRSIRWSPDGRHLAFSLFQTHHWILHTMNMDDASYKSLGIRGMDPQWSPDGKRLAYIERRQIGVVEVETGEHRVFSSDTSVLSIAGWTADGVIFVGSTGRNLDLYRVNIETGKEERLTRGVFPSDAITSPDGLMTAYAMMPNPSVGMFRFDLQTLKTTPITSAVDHVTPALGWSGDSQQLTYRVDGEIAIIHHDGTGKAVLTNDTMLKSSPFWRGTNYPP